jgi:hypothetical protein
MFKAIDQWLPGYMASVLRRPPQTSGLRHLIFCLVDHFEPVHGEPDAARRGPAVRDWLQRYREAMVPFRDADGQTPRHTFFYPAEESEPECLTPLAEACRAGLGEVEIHLHHRNDTAAGLTAQLNEFRDLLRREYGLLGSDAAGRIRYGFIHGNWALCNSRPDGDWCGVNDELTVLAETGCYADFTFPSAPSPTQPRMVNALYLARDRGGRPRGADSGVLCSVEAVGAGIQNFSRKAAEVAKEEQSIDGAPISCRFEASRQQMGTPVVPGGQAEDTVCEPSQVNGDPLRGASRLRDGTHRAAFWISPSALSAPLRETESDLLIVQGPLGVNWKRRKWGILPRLENAALTGVNPPTPDRVDLWVRQGIHVIGRPEWIFVKVHTHGFDPGSRSLFTDGRLVDFHRDLQRRYNDGVKWQLHYVAAREMANLVRAAMAGKGGDPGAWRDFEVRRPPFRGG